MATRPSKGATTKPSAPVAAAPLFRAGLDALGFGFAVFDKDLKLVRSNKAFRTLRGYPAALCQIKKEGYEGIDEKPAGTGPYEYGGRTTGESIWFKLAEGDHWRGERPDFREIEIPK